MATADFDEEDPDVRLSIPLRALAEQFNCPVCFSTIQHCMMTPCGHNFCQACILECINREHICPCCRHECVKSQLLHNHHHDAVVDIISREREKASKVFFEQLIAGAPGEAPAAPAPAGAPAAVRALTPIEAVLQKHLRRSLGAYDGYAAELRARFEASASALQRTHAAELSSTRASWQTRIRTAELTGAETADLRAGLDDALRTRTAEFQAELARISDSHRQSEALLGECYDRFLQANLTAPSFAPVPVSVFVAAHKLWVRDITLGHLDTLPVLRAAVCAGLAAQSKPVAEVPPACTFFLLPPQPAGAVPADLGPAVQLSDERTPVFAYGVYAGALIELRGQLPLQSQVCFSAVPFDANARTSLDYMSCRTCNENWLCPACVTHCHAGHELAVHIRNHAPKWACCYCYKTGKCALDNAKTKKKPTAGAAAAAGAAE